MSLLNIMGIGHGAVWGNSDPSPTPSQHWSGWSAPPRRYPFQHQPQATGPSPFGAIGDGRPSRSTKPSSPATPSSSLLDPRACEFYPGVASLQSASASKLDPRACAFYPEVSSLRATSSPMIDPLACAFMPGMTWSSSGSERSGTSVWTPESSLCEYDGLFVPVCPPVVPTAIWQDDGLFVPVYPPVHPPVVQKAVWEDDGLFVPVYPPVVRKADWEDDDFEPEPRNP